MFDGRNMYLGGSHGDLWVVIIVVVYVECAGLQIGREGLLQGVEATCVASCALFGVFVVQLVVFVVVVRQSTCACTCIY